MRMGGGQGGEGMKRRRGWEDEEKRGRGKRREEKLVRVLDLAWNMICSPCLRAP